MLCHLVAGNERFDQIVSHVFSLKRSSFAVIEAIPAGVALQTDALRP
jgi:hypothetical protein